MDKEDLKILEEAVSPWKLWAELENDIESISCTWPRWIFRFVFDEIKKMNLVSIPTYIKTQDPGIEIRSPKIGIFSIQYDTENDEGFYYAFSSADEEEVIKGHLSKLGNLKDGAPLLRFPVRELFYKFTREGK